MESVLEFSMRCHEDTLKFTKKMCTGQMFWVVFNIALVLFDWSTFINSPSHLTAFSFGAMCITTLWSLVFLLSSYSDLRTEKHHLRFLKELRETQIASGEREQFLQAKNHYEQLIANLKENQNDKGI
jgi:hypothetical protein